LNEQSQLGEDLIVSRAPHAGVEVAPLSQVICRI
jgi:hypothetical protein